MQQIFYVTLDPEKSLGIEDLIPSYHILYSENSQLAVPIGDNGIDIKNFPKPEGAKLFNTGKLLENENLQKYIKERASGKPDVLVFKNDPHIQKMCDTLGYNLLNPNTDLPHKLENKVNFSKYLDLHETFLQPKYEAFEKLSDLKYEDIKNKFGNEFVVQFYFGHSGNSTFFINDEYELHDLQHKYPLRKGKIVKKIKGPAYTINACITRLGVIIGGISEQITGIEMLTPSKGGTIGNDFTQRHLTNSLRADLISKTMDFGNLLMKEGHNGIFGLDFVLDLEECEFYLIEANIRQTMSCGYVSYLQRLNKNVPIMLWHALELMNHNYYERFKCLSEQDEEWINFELEEFRLAPDKLEINIKNNQPMSASQVFFRNVKPNNVKMVDQFPTGVYRIRGRLPEQTIKMEEDPEKSYPAVYRLREDGFSTLCMIKRGYNIMQANEEEGFFISCAPQDSIIPEIGEIGRIQFFESAFAAKNGNDLNGWLVDVIKAIYENIRLVKLSA